MLEVRRCAGKVPRSNGSTNWQTLISRWPEPVRHYKILGQNGSRRAERRCGGEVVGQRMRWLGGAVVVVRWWGSEVAIKFSCISRNHAGHSKSAQSFRDLTTSPPHLTQPPHHLTVSSLQRGKNARRQLAI